MNAVGVAKVTLVGFCAVALQVSVASQLPIAGAMVDVVLVATIAAGLAAGPQAGAGMGFATGLLIDLLGAGPVGLTALVYTLVGYGVGLSQLGVLRSSRLIPVAASALAAAIATLAYALMAEVIGQHIFDLVNLPRVITVVTVSTTVLCLPARAVMGWAFSDDHASTFPRISRW